MRISLIQNSPSVGFKSNNRRITDKSGGLLYKTTTYFFRDDLDWHGLINLLNNKYRNTPKVNIINHACSNGPEVYSLIIQLGLSLGKTAEKFFPILAKDINPDNIINAQKGSQIGINNNDLYKISYYTNNNLNRFFSYSPAQSSEYHLALKPRPILKDKVIFQQGDILQDVSEIQFQNTVLLCRNFWQYLKDSNCKFLAQKLGEKMDKTSLLVLGEHDILSSNADKYLAENGFRRLFNRYVYEKST